MNNLNHNQPPLTALVDQWLELKKLEQDARLARVAHEAVLLPCLDQVPQGSKTTTLSDGRKVTVKNGDSYGVDWQEWLKVKDQIPESLNPIKIKEVLSEPSLRFLMNNEPDLYKILSKAFIARPQKPSITVKEAPHCV